MPRKIVIVSQVFVPDPASVGQHMADVAFEMARRGHAVTVFASARGYENPTIRYPLHETIRGVDVHRFDRASFGKRSIFTRVVGVLSFMSQTFVRLLREPNVDAIFFSTSPPLIGFVVAIVALLRRIPIAYWAMDLNPDQLIAMRKIGPRSPIAWLLERVNRFILRQSELVVALDRFMADRLSYRAPLQDRMLVMPPWPHEDHLGGDTCSVSPPLADAHLPPPPTDNSFRQAHGLTGKFVIMYSGNHSPSNPLDTLLAASLAFAGDDDVRFVFVGGGIAKKDVDAHVARHGLKNVLSLPYQPIEALRHSLSAADVHVVSLGDEMVGIIHPCKIYGAMAVGRPILYLGPRPSHVTDLLDAHGIGWSVAHGDTAACERTIREILQTPTPRLRQMGATARTVLSQSLTQRKLCGEFCDALESAFWPAPSKATVAPPRGDTTLQQTLWPVGQTPVSTPHGT